ncbi:MAG: hypothetical protein IKC70_05290 [Bacteroidaceae bacterium]|nr:hypothetical protein [Bacteroidaceae bacterium]
MKAFNKLLMMLIMAFGMFAFNACSSDDDDVLPKDPDEIIQEGKWTVNGNTYTYTQSMDYGYGVSYSMKWVLVFGSNDKCTSSKCEYTFSDKSIAQAFYDEWLADDEAAPIQISGRTVTIDHTETYKDMDKETLLVVIEAMSGGF